MYHKGFLSKFILLSLLSTTFPVKKTKEGRCICRIVYKSLQLKAYIILRASLLFSYLQTLPNTQLHFCNVGTWTFLFGTERYVSFLLLSFRSCGRRVVCPEKSKITWPIIPGSSPLGPVWTSECVVVVLFILLKEKASKPTCQHSKYSFFSKYFFLEGRRALIKHATLHPNKKCARSELNPYARSPYICCYFCTSRFIKMARMPEWSIIQDASCENITPCLAITKMNS